MTYNRRCKCGYKTHTYETEENGKKLCPQCKRIHERNKLSTDDEYTATVRAGINPRRN